METTAGIIGVIVLSLSCVGTIIFVGVGWGKVNEKVANQEKRLEATGETLVRIFNRLDSVAEGVNLIKGYLGLNGNSSRDD